MSLKRTDLAKNLNLKIQGQMQHAAVPNRFAQGAAMPDRREQRKLDQAAGLVPFAVKLNKDLVARLTELAAAQQVTLNALVDQLLRAGLAQQPAAAPVKAADKAPAAKPKAKPAAKKPAAQPAEKPAAAPVAKKAAAKKAPVKQAAAKPASKPATKAAKKAAR